VGASQLPFDLEQLSPPKHKPKERHQMSSINPDGLRSDLIVQARTNEKNHLFQISFNDYHDARRVAESFGMDAGQLLLAAHGVTEPLPGQEDLLAEAPDTEVNDFTRIMLPADEHAQKALQRQARYCGKEVLEYVADLVIRGLLEDERKSILDPKTGEVIGRRDRFGKIWKSIRLANSEPNPDAPASAWKEAV
jgi:hypothetical protein